MKFLKIALAFVLAFQTRTHAASSCTRVIDRIENADQELNRLVPNHLAKATSFWVEVAKKNHRSLHQLTSMKSEAFSTSIDFALTALKKRREQVRVFSHQKNNLRDKAHADLIVLSVAISRLEQLKKTSLTYGEWLRTMNALTKVFDLGLYALSGPKIALPHPTYQTADFNRDLENENLQEDYVLHLPFDISWMAGQNEITYENFNAIGAYPIYLYGLAVELMAADGQFFRPSAFKQHDDNHNFIIYKKSLEPKMSREEKLKKISDLLEFEIARQNFIREKVPEYLRPCFEMVYFYLWHERSERPDPETMRLATRSDLQAEMIRQIDLRSRANDLGAFSKVMISEAVSKLAEFLER